MIINEDEINQKQTMTGQNGELFLLSASIIHKREIKVNMTNIKNFY